MNITGIPQAINSQLLGGTNLTAAQLLVTVAIVFLLCLPAILSHSRGGSTMIMAMFGVFLCTALSWCPNDIAIVLLAGIAILGAMKIGGIFE